MSWLHLSSCSFISVEKSVLHAIVSYNCFCVLPYEHTRAEQYSPLRVPPELYGLMRSGDYTKRVSLCERFLISPTTSWLLPFILAFFVSLFFVSLPPGQGRLVFLLDYSETRTTSSCLLSRIPRRVFTVMPLRFIILTVSKLPSPSPQQNHVRSLCFCPET